MRLWTTSRHGYTIVQIILGILFAVFGLCLGDIVTRFFVRIRYDPEFDPRRDDPDRNVPERTDPERTDPERVGTERQSLLPRSHGAPDNQGDGGVKKAAQDLKSRLRKATRISKTVCFLVAVTIAILQVFFFPLTGPGVVLSAANPCGVFNLAPDASDFNRQLDDETQAEKERRAGSYMHDCYTQRFASYSRNEPETIDPGRCEFFDSQELVYKKLPGRQQCPFVNRNACLDPYGAVEFVTPYINSSTLGVNSARLSSIRRRTVCTPLSMNPTYVDAKGSQYPIRYHYGKTLDDDHTFQQEDDPFEWGISAYGVT